MSPAGTSLCCKHFCSRATCKLPSAASHATYDRMPLLLLLLPLPLLAGWLAGCAGVAHL
jgi:hypothetical protein